MLAPERSRATLYSIDIYDKKYRCSVKYRSSIDNCIVLTYANLCMRVFFVYAKVASMKQQKATTKPKHNMNVESQLQLVFSFSRLGKIGTVKYLRLIILSKTNLKSILKVHPFKNCFINLCDISKSNNWAGG